MRAFPLPYDHAVDAPRAGHVARAWDSGPPVETARFGTWVFLGSEAFFFGGLLAAYVVLRSASRAWEEPLALGLGLALTALLVASSLAASAAVRALRRGERARGAQRVLWAGLLAGLFLGLQAWEWCQLLQAGFTPQASLAGASFYVLTGAHGLHVLGGALWLLGSACALRRAGSGSLHAELAALYQHFVDLVWLVLFAILYLS
ncbi:MAG: heme-copper oxidase subunit III [Planctomycetes bacterium]|nr:heme-copper oxidase subunit III [Planctomycetota bacterium]